MHYFAKYFFSGSNEIGVVLIGGDAAYACFCREDSEAVKSWEFWYKVNRLDSICL